MLEIWWYNSWICSLHWIFYSIIMDICDGCRTQSMPTSVKFDTCSKFIFSVVNQCSTCFQEDINSASQKIIVQNSPHLTLSFYNHEAAWFRSFVHCTSKHFFFLHKSVSSVPKCREWYILKKNILAHTNLCISSEKITSVGL